MVSLPTRARATLGAAFLVAACSGATGAPSTAPAVTTTAPTTAPTAAATLPPTPPPAVTERPSAGPSPVRDPGTARTDARGVRQVWVPGGSFTMGSEPGSATPPAWATNTFASEHPAHAVTLTRGYWLDETEVTVAEFAAFKAAGGYTTRANWSTDGWAWLQSRGGIALPLQCIALQADQPQVCVTWFEADAYARWRGGRLPTEAEWEFAARGPESNVYPWGDTFDAAKANVEGATGPVAVGGYPKGASWIGALDMAGNAMEWVADWWSGSYFASSPGEDPAGPATGAIKIEKGGWWGPPAGTGAFVARSAFRLDEDPPTYQDHHIGFRIVSDS